MRLPTRRTTEVLMPELGGLTLGTRNAILMIEMSHPIDINEVKSRISEGCFFAVGSYARYKLEKVHLEDDCGADFHLKRLYLRNGSISDGGIILDFQLKATENWVDEGDLIKYALATKNYNDMVGRNINGIQPIILILMCLPEDQGTWVCCGSEDITFRKNMYWYHTDETEIRDNENSTITLKFPKNNLLTHETFTTLVNEFGTRKA
jgi:hypothetical protein